LGDPSSGGPGGNSGPCGNPSCSEPAGGSGSGSSISWRSSTAARIPCSDGGAMSTKDPAGPAVGMERPKNAAHFLTAFEVMATMSQCPIADWAIYLVPLLTGKARAAYIAMDMEEKYDIHTETYRLRFRAMEVLPEETPK